MTAYADHRATPPDTEIRISLESGSPDAEWVHARSLGRDRYRISNVPFFASDIGLHDVVVALSVDCDVPGCDEPDCSVLEVVDVVERVTHLRFVFQLSAASDMQEVLRAARDLDVATEGLGERAFVSNLRDRTHAAAFVALLEQHADWFESYDVHGAAAHPSSSGRR